MKREDSMLSEAEESEKLELFISCRNLEDLDFITVTDSFLVIKLVENKVEKVILKTKVYWNDLNPNYAETCMLQFFFQIKQKLIFQVYHYEAVPKLVGKMETSVGQIFGSPEHGFVKQIINTRGKQSGKIIVRCEKQEKTKKKVITLKLGAKNLPNLTWWYFFGGTNPFFRIFRKRKSDELLVYESQVIQNNVNPSWKEFRLSERKLNSNEIKNSFEVRLYNFSKTGNHELIGVALLSVEKLEGKVTSFQIKDKNNEKGSLMIENYYRRIQYQFGDFIQCGLQLSLVTCIDFTASNGNVNDKNSLHFVTPTTKSKYQIALETITNILLDYDYDKLVPVFGFGAKVKHPNFNTENLVHHCFPINGNTANPNLYQTEEIINQYRQILKFITLSGPTKFGELMKEAMGQCRKFKKEGTNYMILFILTDGEIHDKQEVIDLLIECNTLPISVIIVGIGEGQFEIMNELDDDNCDMVDSKGNHTQRDLVQFVEFNKFSNNGIELARQVLYELPRQVEEYFQLLNISPSDIQSQYKEDDIMKIMKLKDEMNQK